MTKAEQQFRLVWDNDIPVCLGFEISDWKDINWRKAEKRVFKLQKRIYAASRRGDIKLCRKLQKTLMRSWCAIRWSLNHGISPYISYPRRNPRVTLNFRCDVGESPTYQTQV
ncbi:reverse transcriptase N-terminal domain-containing protein [Scytonema sp. UIC 10036]|uniref:reverse transcriptase N-terminal domain-containing protein n=1 Tax=Scytonema sp. UIC 10036 TaxID=2304196 RepID=UPI001FA99CFF|nr:reverse transcriptase N-terminal domain-containing protein [Scytonema sp. UIC 10036]